MIVTGASGFVGQSIMQYFDNENTKIKALSLRDRNWEKYICNTEATVIIHLAGKAHDTANTSSSEEYFKVNRDLTIAVFNSFLRSNVRDFFYFSSVKAIADTVTNEVLLESDVAAPVTPYGKSKLEAEEYLISQELPNDKRLFIIRPCMIHGPGNKGNLNLLYKIVKKGLPWPLSSFHNNRSFLSIGNLNFLIKKMIEDMNLPSGVYNFADDEPLSTNDLVVLIGETIGKRSHLINIPSFLIKSMAFVGDYLPIGFNNDRLKKLTESYVVSNEKIKNALGIVVLPISTKDGMVITLKSFEE